MVRRQLARRRSCHAGLQLSSSCGISFGVGAACSRRLDLVVPPWRSDVPGDQGRNNPPGAGGQAAHGHTARAEPRGEDRAPPRGLGMAHRRAPRRISGAGLCLSRRRVRRRPRRAEAVRGRRRDQRDRRLLDQQLLAGADGGVDAVVRVEPRTGVVDGRLPGRARREVLRHRPGLGQG